MRPFYEIILDVVISENITKMVTEFNKYTLRVAKDANKYEIRQAIVVGFDIKSQDIKSIKTLICHGKPKRLGRYHGHQPDWKKAVVTLKPGIVLPLAAIES
ncbi:MAG: 50S ribosomal protein L23 [Deltaproteobacteria bacterium]|jgi:large subunit ribosomal protein L23|nr:50S ribosomal protein L23 [Deltaproteobacteria bacterium]